jgi:radical SAM protein with 4Fe4S-binding SPASM domain
MTTGENSYLDFSARIHDQAARKDRVIKAQMELTYGCNLRCKHCYTDCYNIPEFVNRELSTEEILRILDQMHEEGVLWLNFTGGEIFMRKDFFTLYDYAYQKGFILTLFTNGTVFTETILKRLQENPPFFIDISCHSVNADAFDAFTQVKGSFELFTRGLEKLKKSGLPFRLKTKAMTWNKEELPDLRAFYESLGMTLSFTTSLAPRLDGDLAPLEMRLSPEEIEQLETQEKIYLEDETSCKSREDWMGAPADASLYRCHCATDSIHINAWGELGTCSFAYESRASLRQYSLRAAIEKVFSEIRALRYTTNTPCASCRIHVFCEKKPTEARLESGDREKPILYYCDLAKSRAERLTGRSIPHPLQTERT